MLEHGGRLVVIKQQYPQVNDDWIDLSTGVSPFSYPAKRLDYDLLHHLPQISSEFLQTAKQYYLDQTYLNKSYLNQNNSDQTNLNNAPINNHWPNPLVANGSQQIIQCLPLLWQQSHLIDHQSETENQNQAAQLSFKKATVWLPKQGYKEHEFHWRLMGHNIQHYQRLSDIIITHNTVVIIINPNNPTTEVTSLDDVLEMEQKLTQNNGWLIIDEAFMDGLSYDHSRLSHPVSATTFVLRSLGKFFGLAGLRVGFVWCDKFWRMQLKPLIGPWPVSGVSLHIAEQALADTHWQQQQLNRLLNQRNALEALLIDYFNVRNIKVTLKTSPLFVTVELDNAEQVFSQLCLKGIYVRLLDCKTGLRFGLPNHNDLQQLKLRLD